jgi:hypothetical protein
MFPNCSLAKLKVLILGSFWSYKPPKYEWRWLFLKPCRSHKFVRVEFHETWVAWFLSWKCLLPVHYPPVGSFCSNFQLLHRFPNAKAQQQPWLSLGSMYIRHFILASVCFLSWSGVRLLILKPAYILATANWDTTPIISQSKSSPDSCWYSKPHETSHIPVVSNMAGLFSISYMGCHPSQWRTHIFQDGYCTTNSDGLMRRISRCSHSGKCGSGGRMADGMPEKDMRICSMTINIVYNYST